jgi:serine/threonine protein kinase
VPQEFLPRSNGNTFYLDASIQLAVQALIWDQKYVGAIITNENGDSNDFIYVEEKSLDTASSLSEYIVRLPSYTEMHARMIFRQIVQIIKLCHANGLAHRNLLFSSFLIDSTVREHEVHSRLYISCSIIHLTLFYIDSLTTITILSCAAFSILKQLNKASH